MKKVVIILILIVGLTGCAPDNELLTSDNVYTVAEQSNEYTAKIVSKASNQYGLLENSSTDLTNGKFIKKDEILYKNYHQELTDQVSTINYELAYLNTDKSKLNSEKTTISNKITALKNKINNADEFTKESLKIELSELEMNLTQITEQLATISREIERNNRNLAGISATEIIYAPFSGYVYVSQNQLTIHSQEKLVKLTIRSADFEKIKKLNSELELNDKTYKLKYDYYDLNQIKTIETETYYDLYFKLEKFDQDVPLDYPVIVKEVSSDIYIPTDYVFNNGNDFYVNIGGTKTTIKGNDEKGRFKVTEGLKIGDKLSLEEIYE